jgi:hypothetical protein
MTISDTYHKKCSYKSTVSYKTKNGKCLNKSFDYVIIAFPLTKSLRKQSSFSLDILYRDYLNCEMNTLNAYIVDGTLSLFKNKYSNTLINLHTNDEKSFKFQSIRTCLPINYPSTSSDSKIYLVLSSNSDITKISLDKVFTNFKLIKQTQINVGPLYKKVTYCHLPFPQLIIDGNRSRIYYLNSIEWIESSQETKMINARNIAMLIAKKEISKGEFSRAISACKKFTYVSFLFKDYDALIPYVFFISLTVIMISYVKARS